MAQLTPMRLNAVAACLLSLATARAQNPSNPPAPPSASRQQAAKSAANTIEGIEFRGANHVSEDTLRAMLSSKAGDVYDEDAMRRSFTALWNTGRFDDIRLQTEKGERGGIIVRFILTELPERSLPALAPGTIEGIEFRGADHVSPDTLRAVIASKAGGAYDETAVRRDFTALWNTGRFDDIRLATEKGARGGVVVRFILTERP